MYGKDVLSENQIWYWCIQFANGRTQVDDAASSNSPSTSCVEAKSAADRCPGVWTKVHALNCIKSQRNWIYYLAVHLPLFTMNWGYKKVCFHRVPKNFVEKKKCACADQGVDFLQGIVTGYETNPSYDPWNQICIHGVESPILSEKFIYKEYHGNSAFRTIQVCFLWTFWYVMQH